MKPLNPDCLTSSGTLSHHSIRPAWLAVHGNAWSSQWNNVEGIVANRWWSILQGLLPRGQKGRSQLTIHLLHLAGNWFSRWPLVARAHAQTRCATLVYLPAFLPFAKPFESNCIKITSRVRAIITEERVAFINDRVAACAITSTHSVHLFRAEDVPPDRSASTSLSKTIRRPRYALVYSLVRLQNTTCVR